LECEKELFECDSHPQTKKVRTLSREKYTMKLDTSRLQVSSFIVYVAEKKTTMHP
jgi:hypothetical protein